MMYVTRCQNKKIERDTERKRGGRGRRDRKTGGLREEGQRQSGRQRETHIHTDGQTDK